MISISTKGRYATRILIALALAKPGLTVKRSLIAKAEGISEDYVEQILMKLKSAGIVVSHRGKRGGFALAQEPSKITLAQLIEAVEGPIALAPCLQDNSCERISACVTSRVWKEAGDRLRNFLATKTIAALAQEAAKLGDSKALSFQI